MPFDDIEKRLQRYASAQQERELKLYKFVQAYRLAFPTNAKWLLYGPGSESIDKTQFRWDTTAVQGLKTFASNIQTLLMPPFQQWAKFKPAPNVIESEIKPVEDALVHASNVLYQAIDASNLMLESNIAFQDMGIAVGLLQISSTGDSRRPIAFKAIPMHTVALGEYDGRIEDVYRKVCVPARDIKALWPDAQLTQSINTMISSSPGTEIELLEGTIYYPNNEPHERYLYFVMQMDTNTDLVNRPQSMSRWIPFRFAVSPGEVWGEGPILQILDTIRITNKIVEMDLLNAGLKIARPLFVNSTQVLNPNLIKIEPGAIIRVNNTAPGQLPIVPLDLAGDFQFDQVTLTNYQSQIRDALFADPLGPEHTPNQSATEASIREQNWTRKSSSSIGRMTNELLRPTILKTCVLLQEMGLMPPDFHIEPSTLQITLNGMEIDIDFLSPLATISDLQDAQRFIQYTQSLQAIVGPQLVPAMLNTEKIPQFLAEKMDIRSDLVKGPGEILAMQQQLQQQAQQMQQAQQQQQQGQSSPQPTDLSQPPQIPKLNIGQ